MIVLIISFLLLGQSFSAEVYVAPDGNDTANGSNLCPLRSLSAAKKKVRELKRTESEDITVYFSRGEYRFHHTIKFDQRDSGQKGQKILYKAQPGEQVVFLASETVKNWKKDSTRSNVYYANVEEGLIFRQLYLGGELLIRSRHPNRSKKYKFGPQYEVTGNSAQQFYVSKRFSYWFTRLKKPTETEFVVSSHWYQQRFLLGNVEEKKNYLAISPLFKEDKMTKKEYFYEGSYFFLENAIEFLDSDKEWYHDRENNLLYVYLDNAKYAVDKEFTIPKVNTLISLEGTPEEPIRNIEFQDIIFEGSNWDRPSRKGLNITQFVQPKGESRGWNNQNRPIGMLRAKHTKNLAFRNNTFRNAGAHGIEFFQNCDHADIEGNKFYQIAANGIEIDSLSMKNPIDSEKSSGVAIWNNTFERIACDYTNGGAIFAHNVDGLIIEHNVIKNMPYSGIQLGNQPGGLHFIGCEHNRIRYNLIHDVLLLHSDGGGIYTLGGVHKNTVIAENYIHSLKKSEYGGKPRISYIYLDNYSSKIVVEKNVLQGGIAEERNRAEGNIFRENTSYSQRVIENAGIQVGYNPR